MNKETRNNWATGTSGEWYHDKYIAGYYDENGKLVVCEEYGTDADFGKHSTEVQNGEGYYNENGKFVRYSNRD